MNLDGCIVSSTLRENGRIWQRHQLHRRGQHLRGLPQCGGRGGSLGLHTWCGDAPEQRGAGKPHVKTKPPNCESQESISVSASATGQRQSWASKTMRGPLAGLRGPSICFNTEEEGCGPRGNCHCRLRQGSREESHRRWRRGRVAKVLANHLKDVGFGFCPEWNGAVWRVLSRERALSNILGYAHLLSLLKESGIGGQA